ncbi:hypothetical protein ACOSP7_029397 [Xanthoceras sorbifolium]
MISKEGSGSLNNVPELDGGHKPSLESFGADQFDDDHIEERKKKMSFFNWWNFGLCSGLLLGVTVVIYVQDHAFLHCYNDSCCPGSEEETWVCRKRSDKGFTLYKRMSSTRKMGAVGLARISTAAA